MDNQFKNWSKLKSPKSLMKEEKINGPHTNVDLINCVKIRGEKDKYSCITENTYYTNQSEITDFTKNILNITSLSCKSIMYLLNKNFLNDSDIMTNILMCLEELKDDQGIYSNLLNYIVLYFRIIEIIDAKYKSEIDDKKRKEDVNNDIEKLNTYYNNFFNNVEDINKFANNLNYFPNVGELNITEINTNKVISIIENVKQELFDEQKVYSNPNFLYNKYITYLQKSYSIIDKLISVDDYDKLFKYIFVNNYNMLLNYNENNYLIDYFELSSSLMYMYLYKSYLFKNLDDIDFFIQIVLRDILNIYYISNNFSEELIQEYYDVVVFNNFMKRYSNVFYYFEEKLIHFKINEVVSIYYIETEKLQNVIKEYNLYDNYFYKHNITDFFKENDNYIIGESGREIDDLAELIQYGELNEFRPFENASSLDFCFRTNSRYTNESADVIYIEKDGDTKVNILFDSKVYSTDEDINKILYQCFLYAQYIMPCYNITDNLYLGVINPVNGSYYVYTYNDVKKYFDDDIKLCKLCDYKFIDLNQEYKKLCELCKEKKKDKKEKKN